MPKAKNLKYMRQQCQLSQQAFADAIGSTKATVIAWEKKKRAIPVPTSKRIAKFFDISYAEFCDVDLELRDMSTFMDKEHPTYDELKQLLKFRRLSDNTKQIIRYLIDVALEAESNQKGGA